MLYWQVKCIEISHFFYLYLHKHITKTPMLKYILLVLKGGAMGAADVVPGVSGGTIAFITGIYEDLLRSIRSFDLTAVKLLFSGRFAQLWKHINGAFIFPVLSGIAISILSLAKIMLYLLSNHAIETWSFFFGLIIASSILVAKEIKKWNTSTIISMIIGIVIAYWITIASPSSTPNDWWFIILSGAIAICAMILPGISGSFILLLLGKYMFIMQALNDFNLYIISLFIVGAGAGIISFSHLLTWLLKKFHGITIALLMGFMIGSLNKVWPWKEILKTYTNNHGEQIPLLETNILPSQFEAITSQPAHFALAVIMCALGFGLILGIEGLAGLLKSNKK